MKKVPLGKGQYALVDDEDFWKCLQHSWYIDGGYPKARVNGRIMRLHSFVMGSKTLFDHKDRDRLNCQKTNLRSATQQQNCWNRKPPEGKYKGVSKVEGYELWRARITFSENIVHLGYYKTPEEAALAYNRAAIRLYGEFAALNQIREKEKE